jgi:hypothetical protein
MPDAPTDAMPAQPADPDRPAQAAAPPTRTGRLLGLVGRLVDYGQSLLTALRQRNTQDAPPEVAWVFSTASLALIIARLTRGLRIAEVLQTRLIRGARRRDASEPPLPPLRLPSARPRAAGPAKPRPPRWPSDDADALNNLPSAQEIARRLRHRSIGDVITDICNDLGIGPSHPLWREVQAAVRDENGSAVRLIMVPFQKRLAAGVPAPDPALYPPGPNWPLNTLLGSAATAQPP